MDDDERATETPGSSADAPSEPEADVPAIGDVLADRYELVAKLGRGAYGTVYEAQDRQRGGRVAIKLVRSVTPVRQLELRREFRALADASHPNLVMLYELHADETRTFFTMELVAGVDLLTWVRRGGEGLDAGRLRDVVVQLARGLTALHDLGLLHRDLKPSNVLVRTADGRVKLADFGLARRDEPGPTREGPAAVQGTPRYMSPEQAAGLAIGPASDWYAVGVMIYEALCGQTPFEDMHGVALLAAKQLGLPPSPATLAPDVPDDLETLCMALLALQPDARPSGDGVLRCLGHGPDARPRPLGPRLFGRRPELRRLDEILRGVEEGRAGHVHAVVVRAPAGHGKSALVQYFCRRLDARGGFVTLPARCYERETVPHKGIDDLVDRLRERIGSPRAVDGAPALVSLFPALGDVLITTQGAPADPVERRRQAVDALRGLLDVAAAGRTLVIVLEDLHWFDDDSVRLLAELVTRRAAAPTLFVATTRPVEPDTPAARLWAELRAAGSSELALGPLSEEALAELARQNLAEPEGAAALASTIAKAAHGNPLLAVELARDAGVGSIDASGTVDLDAVIDRRVRTLQPRVRRLLETIAVAGRPVAQDVAVEAADVADDANPVLAMLRGRGFVQTAGTGLTDPVEVVHERVGARIAATMDADASRRAHARLAVALVRRGAEPEAVAYHHERAGERATAANGFATAAERAHAASAYFRAAQLFARALELAAPDHPARPAWLRGRADALAAAGRGAEAGEAYLVARSSAEPSQRSGLHLRAAEQLLRAGQYRRGIEELSQVLRALGLRAPGSEAAALASLAWGRLRVRRRGLAFDPRPASRIDPRELERIDACWAAATGLLQTDVAMGQAYQTQHLLLALRTGEPRRVARALAVESLYAATAGDAEASTARALYDKAAALAAEVDDPQSLALAAIAQAGAAVYRGRFRAALEPLARADAQLRARGRDVAWEMSMASTFRVTALWHLGEVVAMREALADALADAKARHDVHAEIMMRVAYGPLVHLFDGDLVGARTELEACRRDLPDHLRHSTYRYVELLTRVRVCRYATDGAGARAAFVRPPGRWGLALLLQRPPLRTFYAHERGTSAVAAAVDATRPRARAAAIADARECVASLQGQGTAWAAALAAPIEAGLAALAGEPDEVERHLRRAEQDLTALDMRLFGLAARYRRAELARDPSALAQTERALARAGIARPDRMVAVLVPPVRTGVRTGRSAPAR